MEERRFDIAINHYRSRLLAAIVGSWISFTRDCKQRIEECEAIAIHHHWIIATKTSIFKLKWMKYSLNKRRFDIIMGNVMNRLMKLRKGMCWFRMLIQSKRSTQRYQRLSRIYKYKVYIELTKSSNSSVRILHKLKRIVELRRSVTAAICSCIVQSSDCPAVKKRRRLVLCFINILKEMVGYKSQFTIGYQQAAQLCKHQYKRRCFDKFKSSVTSQYSKLAQTSWLCKHRSVRLLRWGLQRLRRQLTVIMQNTFRIKSLDQWAQRCFCKAALRKLRHRAHRDLTIADQVAQLAHYALITASRRVMGRMLHLVKQRYIIKYHVRSKLVMFLLHVRYLRLKSAAVAQWQCHFIKSCRLGTRRMKIADFHLRYRTLRAGFKTCVHYVTTAARQKHALFDGKYALYRKGAMRGMSQLQRFCLKGKQAAIRDWRAVLFWKLWRGSKTIRQLRDNALQRRSKRLMIQDARAAYAVREKKEACVEFLAVAFTNTSSFQGHVHNKLNRQFYLVHKVVAQWKDFVHRKHEQRVRPVPRPPSSSASLPFAPKLATSDQASSARLSRSNTVDCVLAELDSAAVQIAAHTGTVTSGMIGLSRARPRSAVPTSVPLPQSHKNAPLDFRFHSGSLCAVANTEFSSQHDVFDRQHLGPYSYLSVGTVLPRPTYPSTLSEAAVMEKRCEQFGHQSVSVAVGSSKAPPRCGTENVLHQSATESYERMQDLKDVTSLLQVQPVADSSTEPTLEAKLHLASLDPAEDAELGTLLTAAQTSKFSSATQDLLRALLSSPNIRLES